MADLEVGDLIAGTASAGEVVVVADLAYVAGGQAGRVVEMVEERRAAGDAIGRGGAAAGEAGGVAGQTGQGVSIGWACGVADP